MSVPGGFIAPVPIPARNLREEWANSDGFVDWNGADLKCGLDLFLYRREFVTKSLFLFPPPSFFFPYSYRDAEIIAQALMDQVNINITALDLSYGYQFLLIYSSAITTQFGKYSLVISNNRFGKVGGKALTSKHTNPFSNLPNLKAISTHLCFMCMR